MFSPEDKNHLLNSISPSPFSQLEVISPGSDLSFSPTTFRFSPTSNFSPMLLSKAPNIADSEPFCNDVNSQLFSPSIFSPGLSFQKDSESNVGVFVINSGERLSFGENLKATGNKIKQLKKRDILSLSKDLSENAIDGVNSNINSKKSNKQKNSVKSDQELLINALDRDQDSSFLNEFGPNVRTDHLLPFDNLTSDEKKLVSAKKAKKPNIFFSSPATILRPTAPSNMSPDMINQSENPGCNCKKSKCLKL